ncbi:MAG: tetratricopeptide repeat protein [Pseudomonadota bacterium]
MDLLNTFWTFIGTETGERTVNVILAVLGAFAAVALWAFGVFGKMWGALFGKSDPNDDASATNLTRDHAKSGIAEAGTKGVAIGQVYGDQTINQGAPNDHTVLSLDDFRAHLKKEREAVQSELAKAHASEKELLTDRIAELARQLSDPKAALVEAEKRNSGLTSLLDREANDIGADRLRDAQFALRHFDYSKADDIFAEIEARAELEVQRAARAAFGRGEVAEQDVRWAQAASHYARAAQLDPQFETLKKASEFAERSGDYSAAVVHSAALLALVQGEGDSERHSAALNAHALNIGQLGRYDEAEQLFLRALAIDDATIGKFHSDYSAHLNNLALVVKAQERYEQAEKLFLQALEIDRATVGKNNPAYATSLNNLALVVQAQGRLKNAEKLFLEVLKIDRKTIGEDHPDHALHLNNLAKMLESQGRLKEAEALFRKALKIDRATIGTGHPNYALHLDSLALVVKAQGRHKEAEELFLEALEIGRTTIGEGHPDFAVNLNHLAVVTQAQGRHEEAEGLYRQALEVFQARLPEDHPNIEIVRNSLANLRGKKG